MKNTIPILIAILFTGCFTLNPPKPTPVIKPYVPIVDVPTQVKVVGSVKEAIDTSAAFVIADAQSVKTSASALLALNPPADMNQLLDLVGINADNIDKNARVILDESGKLTGVQGELVKVQTDYAALRKDFTDSQKQIKERDTIIEQMKSTFAADKKKLVDGYEATIKELKAEIAKLKDSIAATVRKWMIILTFVFVGAAALSIGLGFYLTKPRLFIFAPVFLACASGTYFIGTYFKEIMIAGGIGGVLLIGYMVWKWKEDRDNGVKATTALTQSVTAIEKTDDVTWAKLKPLIAETFSVDTTKIVDTIRADIKAAMNKTE